MIYGLNFNNTHIPDDIRRRFAQRRKVSEPHETVHLRGVCNTVSETGVMFIQAHNGRRRVAMVGPRRIGYDDWYGVYCS